MSGAPDTDRLEALSAAELGAAVAERLVSPTEVVDFFADRIERRNASINAFVYTRFDYAREQAKTLEKRLGRGEDVGPFAGVPFALKDFLPSKKGWTNSHGGVRSLICEDTEDSAFCRAMEEAGGIAIGKTNAPAFAFRGTCDNMLYGATSTPFDVRYNSGGSSGGSAAAVADSLVPIAEATDGGGSIRIPAAWCGCFGFKPSVGVVPSVARPDAWAATHPYCASGGITRTVEDTAILLDHMARFDARDPLCPPRQRIDFTEEMKRPIKGMRVAFTPDLGVFPVEPEVAAITRRAAYALAEAGALVDDVEVKPPRSASEYAAAWCRSISVDTAIALELWRREGLDLVKDHRDELPEEFIYWNDIAARGTILDYYEFNLIRTELYDFQRELFGKYDLVVSPTTVCLPVPNAADGNTLGPRTVAGREVEPLIGFCETFFFNFTGNPAASVPAGLSASGLPVGMQIVGRRFADGDVLAASRAFETVSPWRGIYEIPLSREI